MESRLGSAVRFFVTPIEIWMWHLWHLEMRVFIVFSPEIGQFERKLLQKHGAKVWDFQVPMGT